MGKRQEIIGKLIFLSPPSPSLAKARDTEFCVGRDTQRPSLVDE